LSISAHHRCAAILASCLACSLTTESTAESFALVVGVNDCPGFRLPNGAKPYALQGAEADADAMAALLVDQYGVDAARLQLLKGQAATRRAIESAFQRIAAAARAEDVFIFYFSGHGTQTPDQTPLDEPDDLDEALCTHDCTQQGENLLLDDELALWLEDVPARQVTVVLDCCHAGTGTKAVDDEIVPRFLPRPIPSPAAGKAEERWRELRGVTKDIGRQLTAYFACQPGQLAYERRLRSQNSAARAGQFSHYLQAGLRDSQADSDQDGIVSNEELLAFVRGRLDDTFNQQRPESERQEPLLESQSPRSPVFYLPRPQR
jgi:uncharacterized caspase-like protein